MVLSIEPNLDLAEISPSLKDLSLLSTEKKDLCPEQNTGCDTSTSVVVVFVLKLLFLEEWAITKPPSSLKKKKKYFLFSR